MRALIIDDSAVMRKVIERALRQSGLELSEVVQASNGEEALEVLRTDASNAAKIGLIISDINMPVMDGLTLLSKLNEQNSLIKSVIVSAYGDMQNIRTAMNRGAFDFITKPVDFEDLELTMEKTIRQV